MVKLVGPHHRLPGNFFIKHTSNKKVLVPLREQGQKIQFLRYHLVCRKTDRSARCKHTGCPITLALRQKILGDRPLSHCPLRPICCPAFRSALSTRNSLWRRSAALLPLLWFNLCYACYTTEVCVCQELFCATGGQISTPGSQLLRCR